MFNVRSETRANVRNALFETFGHIPFIYARRIGRQDKSNNGNKKIIIRLKHYFDKQEIICKSKTGRYTFSNFNDDTQEQAEMVHTEYMKKVINLNKYASNLAISCELGRFPIIHKAWYLAIKYWLRLEKGTANILLNKSYKQAKAEYHPWIQSIDYLLDKNGFSDIRITDSNLIPDSFPHIFKQRLKDQHIQNNQSKLHSSNRFRVLAALKDEYIKSPYLTSIHNTDIRLIFARLRVDMNILFSCKTNASTVSICPLCSTECETVEHFLLKCKHFENMRSQFWNDIINYTADISSKSMEYKMKYILNLSGPPEVMNICCKFVGRMYKERESIHNA